MTPRPMEGHRLESVQSAQADFVAEPSAGVIVPFRGIQSIGIPPRHRHTTSPNGIPRRYAPILPHWYPTPI